MKRAAFHYLSTATKVAIPSFIFLAATASTPSFADDKNQREAAMEARLAALEAKLGRINSLEEENRQLRSRLAKTEARSETALKVSEKSLATKRASIPTADIATIKGPIVAPAIAGWSGVYGGINAGYGVGNVNNYTNETTAFPGYNGPLGNLPPSLVSAMHSSDLGYVGGALAGGQVGYNHVFANHVMLGAEADMNWADVYNNTSPTDTGNVEVDQTGALSSTSEYRRVGLDWVGTVRMRLGYDMGRFLPYVTGGFAYGGLSSSIKSAQYSFTNIAPTPGANPVLTGNGNLSNGNNHSVSLGWALGAGAEYMVTDNWSVKGEYLYTQLQGVTTYMNSKSTEASLTKTYTSENTGSFGVHQARVGLNYHTDWLAWKPVVAAY